MAVFASGGIDNSLQGSGRTAPALASYGPHVSVQLSATECRKQDPAMGALPSAHEYVAVAGAVVVLVQVVPDRAAPAAHT